MVSIPHHSHQRQGGGQDGWGEHPSCAAFMGGIQNVDDVPRQSRLDTAKRDVLSVTPPKHNI